MLPHSSNPRINQQVEEVLAAIKYMPHLKKYILREVSPQVQELVNKAIKEGVYGD